MTSALDFSLPNQDQPQRLRRRVNSALRGGLFAYLIVIASTLDVSADTLWNCKYSPTKANSGPYLSLDVEEDDHTLTIRGSEGSDSWNIIADNHAALIAAKPITEWSRATKESYPDRASVERDIKPIGVTVGLISIDKKNRFVSVDLNECRRTAPTASKGALREARAMTSVVSQIEIWRAAHQMMNRYGKRAALEAGNRANEARHKGDQFNAELWESICMHIQDFRRKKPLDGESMN